MVEIRLRFFALFKDLAGRESLSWQVREGTKLEDLKQEIGKTMPWIKDHPAIIAIGGEFKEPDYILEDGDEVDILPPFSGG